MIEIKAEDIAAICEERGARGLRVIDAHLGSPSHNPPVPIHAILPEDEGIGRSYPPLNGFEELRASIASFLSEYLGREADPDHIFVTNGGAQSILLSILAARLKGRKKLLIPAPGFTQYFLNVSDLDIPFDTYDPLADDLVNEIVEKAGRSSAVLINYPHNPTGHLPPASTLRDLWDELAGRGAILINDAAYSQIYYEEKPEVIGDLVADTFSKSIAVPGLRVGYIYWEDADVELMERLMLQTTAGISDLIQKLLSKLIGAVNHEYFEGVREHYRALRDAVVDGARRIGLDFIEPRGAFYLYARHPEVEDSVKLTFRLLDWDPVVGIVPAIAFGGTREWFRISFSRLSRDEIPELMDSIAGASRVLQSS